MKILFEDDALIIIDKPPGYHVHPPENDYPVPRSKVCLYRVRDTIKQKVFPVHRLDVGTSGVLVFAKTKEAASHLGMQFSHHSVQKHYWAIVRGFPAAHGEIDLELASDSSGEMVAAKTSFKTLAQIELPYAVGKKFPTARYTWVDVRPFTGRYHQIRRHFNRISHPLVGDATHGDSHHNRFFREELRIPGLCLRAYKLEFIHPCSAQELVINAPMTDKWNRLHELFKNFDLHHEQQ